MKTLTNEIKIICDYDLLDEQYDFFQLRTTDKYISRGSKILDIDIKSIKSIVFDDGSSLFVLFKKNTCNKSDLELLIKDRKITVKRIFSYNLKPYILAKLFLFSLGSSDYDDFEFNNLSGKLFLFKTERISNTRKTFKALNIDIKACGEDSAKLVGNACTFTSVKNYKKSTIFDTYPRYIFSVKGTLKRTFNKDDNAFIRKSLNGKKAKIPFISFGSKDKFFCKANILLSVMNTFNEKFKGIINIELLTKEVVRKIETKKDNSFFCNIKFLLSNKNIYISNYDKLEEDKEIFDKLVQNMKNFLPFSNIVATNKIQTKQLNIVLIHNQEYYKEKKIVDPYSKFDRSTPIQCVTIEDACYDDLEVIYKTIIKELEIKNEIINEHKILIDDWKSYLFNRQWIFGCLSNNIAYFMNLLPDGSFKMIRKSSEFSAFKEDIYNKLERSLFAVKGDDKMIVADDKGNINVIADTEIIPLPSKELFESNSPRGKSSKEKYLTGVLDINVYDSENCIEYSSGPIGYGVNKTIPNAPHIYKIKILEGTEKMTDIIKTLGVQFVKYNSYTVIPYPFKYIREWILMENKK